MKKRGLLLGLCLLMILSITCTTFCSPVCAKEIKVVIDNVAVKFNASSGYPYVSGGRTLVPLRATMEAFGATVEWDGDAKTAIVRKGTTTVRCKVGEKCIYRNNIKIANDAAAVVKGGRTYLPIRAVLEAFGATVTWNGNVVVKGPDSNYIIYNIENAKAATTNYWPVWNDALALKKAGKYSETIEKICSISSEFIKTNKPASNAMLFKHLGECYANLGDYSKASACFKREAYYWDKDPAMGESCIDANRRANLIKTSAQIYVKSTDQNMGGRIYFGETHEPKGGIMLGAYAENDKNIYNPSAPDRFYMDTFPELVGKDIAAYLIYIPYGYDITKYNSHFERAKAKNKVMQVSLEPHEGLGIIKENDSYLINLAKNMQNSGCKMMLRFAGEMNDVTSKWYSNDPEVYKQKFRIVANIFHQYAPDVPVIWAPNFYPEETMDDYYPGDQYVDYVGISSYKGHKPVTDPLGKGVDRSRWSNQLDTLYSLYGHKKPIMIVEGGSSYMDYDTKKDITEFASNQLKDFYTYLPIKYPNVKMSFMFDNDTGNSKYLLSNNQTYLDAYKKGIASDLYVLDPSAPYKYDYYEIGNNVEVKAESTELCSYITTPYNDVAYVNYYINDVFLGTAYGIPYKVNANLGGYKGKTTKITVKAFNAKDKATVSYSVNVKVK